MKIYVKLFEEFINEFKRELPIMYHGTNHKFDKFSLDKFGSSDGGWLGYGVYFTNDFDYAKSYGESENGSVKSVKLHLKNPYVLSDQTYSSRPLKLMNELGVNNSIGVTRKLKELGHDSIMLTYPDSNIEGGIFYEVCVFDLDTIENI